MKIYKTLVVDPISGKATIDGSDILTISAGDVTVITGSTQFWIGVDEIPKDLLATADGSNSSIFPPMKTLRGEELLSETDISIQNCLANLRDAQLSDLVLTNEKNDLRVPVPVIVDGSIVSVENRSIQIDGSTGLAVVSFTQSTTPKTGSEIRIVHRRPPWAVVSSGSLTLSPLGAESYKTAWIFGSSPSQTPIKIVVREKRNEDLSLVAEDNIPQFFVDDNPEFVDFVKSFMSHASSNKMPLDILRRLSEMKDLDLADDNAIDLLFSELATDFPDTTTADKRILIRLAKIFHSSKGIDKSFSFVANAVHGESCSSVYPEENMFRGSCADWRQQETIRVCTLRQAMIDSANVTKVVGDNLRTTNPGDFPDESSLPLMVGNQIRGLAGGATAMVESVTVSQRGSIFVADIEISGRRGDFGVDEIISCLQPNSSPVFCCVGRIATGVVGSSEVSANSGDVYEFSGTLPPQIIVVSPGDGSAVEIVDPGWMVGESLTATLTSISSTTMTNIGTFVVQTGTVFCGRGRWNKNQSSTSNSVVHPQDNDRFQLYSYSIRSKSGQVLDSGVVENMLHLTGHVYHTEQVHDLHPVTMSPGRNVFLKICSGEGYVNVGSINLKNIPSIFVGERLLEIGEYEIVDPNSTDYEDAATGPGELNFEDSDKSFIKNSVGVVQDLITDDGFGEITSGKTTIRILSETNGIVSAFVNAASTQTDATEVESDIVPATYVPKSAVPAVPLSLISWSLDDSITPYFVETPETESSSRMFERGIILSQGDATAVVYGAAVANGILYACLSSNAINFTAMITRTL